MKIKIKMQYCSEFLILNTRKEPQAFQKKVRENFRKILKNWKEHHRKLNAFNVFRVYNLRF